MYSYVLIYVMNCNDIVGVCIYIHLNGSMTINPFYGERILTAAYMKQMDTDGGFPKWCIPIIYVYKIFGPPPS